MLCNYKNSARKKVTAATLAVTFAFSSFSALTPYATDIDTSTGTATQGSDWSSFAFDFGEPDPNFGRREKYKDPTVFTKFDIKKEEIYAKYQAIIDDADLDAKYKAACDAAKAEFDAKSNENNNIFEDALAKYIDHQINSDEYNAIVSKAAEDDNKIWLEYSSTLIREEQDYEQKLQTILDERDAAIKAAESELGEEVYTASANSDVTAELSEAAQELVEAAAAGNENGMEIALAKVNEANSELHLADLARDLIDSIASDNEEAISTAVVNVNKAANAENEADEALKKLVGTTEDNSVKQEKAQLEHEDILAKVQETAAKMQEAEGKERRSTISYATTRWKNPTERYAARTESYTARAEWYTATAEWYAARAEWYAANGFENTFSRQQEAWNKAQAEEWYARSLE